MDKDNDLLAKNQAEGGGNTAEGSVDNPSATARDTEDFNEGFANEIEETGDGEAIDESADGETEDAVTEADDGEKPLSRGLFEWTQALVFSIILIVMLFSTTIRIIGVKGDSMVDTLHENDRIAISNLFFTPKYGDIVVLRKLEFMEEPIVKRVIAVEGQTVDIDFGAGAVYVDGVAINEPYIRDLTTLAFDTVFPLTVPDNHVFVMGDNRLHSWDSRLTTLGVVDNRNILGRLLFRVFPFSDIGVVK